MLVIVPPGRRRAPATHVCADMRAGVSTGMWEEMRAGMCVDVCIDMCVVRWSDKAVNHQ